MSLSHRSTLGCLNQPPSYHSHSMTQSSTHSPMAKTQHTQRAASPQGDGGIRKRVCKACDRCRLKKSKCDGSSPCTRCKQDNAICRFGERKKSHDKVYPKGYTETLETQQSLLCDGLDALYKKLLEAGIWDGLPLQETNGKVLTHDILKNLNLLDKKADGSEPEAFEEDCEKMQARLIAQGAGYAQHRRGSASSESDHSHPSPHSHARSQSNGTSTMTQPTPMFKQDFHFQNSAPSSPPPAHSPAPLQQRHSFPAAQSSPLQHHSPARNEPQLYQSDWSHDQDGKYMMQSDFAIQTPDIDQGLNNMDPMIEFGQWSQAASAPYPNMDMTAMSSFPQQMISGFGSAPRLQDGMLSGYNVDSLMDQEFLHFASQTSPA